MNARYNGISYRRIDDTPPRLFPPKPPRHRFRVTVSGRYSRWTARLTETNRERGKEPVTLQGQGVTVCDALYDLEHAIREHAWGWPAGWERREEAIGLVNWEIGRERARAEREWSRGEVAWRETQQI